MLAAKAVVLGAVTLAAGELVAFASLFVVQAVLAGHHQGVSLSRPGVPGAVLAALHPAANLFSPGLSLLVLLAWPAAALAVVAVLITRRDI